MRLAEKRAIVTGAAGGIGRGIADAFAREGANVTLCDVAVAPLHDLINGQKYVRADVSNFADWQSLVEEASQGARRIDVLVNNAAVIDQFAIDNMDLEAWQRAIAVNQTGPLFGMKCVIPYMRRQGGGSIINVTSSWSIVAAPGLASYHATKGALRMMTKNAAMTYAPDRIRVNAIVPGIVRTPMTDKQPTTQAAIEQTPLGLAEPEDIAYAAVFLASEESRMVTGSDLFVDGAYTVG